MEKRFFTIDDIKHVKSKVVLVRVDINCPIDPATGRITDDERIRLHSTATIAELARKGAKVVVIAHQGRPGDIDFVSLREHAKLVGKYAKSEVRFIDELFSTRVAGEIKAMKDGEMLLLENVRFYSEELLERPADALAKTNMVQAFSAVCDYFVNDAFAAIHRGQASLVGFGEVLPTVAGRLIEREGFALDKASQDGKKPAVFVMGGTKVDDSVKAIEHLLAGGKADHVLAGGLLGNFFLMAKGCDIGNKSAETIRGKGFEKLLPFGKELLEKYKGKIEMPEDVAIMDGERKDIPVSSLPTSHFIGDIGRKTIERYCGLIRKAKTIVFNSPMGVYERAEFREGTESMLKAAAETDAYKVVGGGHTDDMVNRLGLSRKFDHVSSGGRAVLYYLAGKNLPVIEMLERAKERWKGKLDKV